MRNYALIAGIVLLGTIATAASAGTGDSTGWRAPAATFTATSNTPTVKYVETDRGGLTFREGQAGAIWFTKNIDLTPPTGSFWNAMKVHFSDPVDGRSAMVWVGLYRVDLDTGATTLLGVRYSEDPDHNELLFCLEQPGQDGTTVRMMIVDPPGDARSYAYYIRAGLYRSDPSTPAPAFHGVAVIEWHDIDGGFGLLHCAEAGGR